MALNQLRLLIKPQTLLEVKITTMLKETTTEMRFTETTVLTVKLNKDMLTYKALNNKHPYMVTAKCADRPPLSLQTTRAAIS